MKRDKILHLAGEFDVRETGSGVFTVFENGITHATSVQSFADLSLAVAYADYKAKARERRKAS